MRSRTKRLVSYGIPFFVLVFGGALGLVQFSQVRYDYRKQETLSRDEMEKVGVKFRNPNDVSLEQEFEKIKKMDIDNWENKRGPRPWEQDNPTVVELRQRAEANQKS